jgi:hypothetical protein
LTAIIAIRRLFASRVYLAFSVIFAADYIITPALAPKIAFQDIYCATPLMLRCTLLLFGQSQMITPTFSSPSFQPAFRRASQPKALNSQISCFRPLSSIAPGRRFSRRLFVDFESQPDTIYFAAAADFFAGHYYMPPPAFADIFKEEPLRFCRLSSLFADAIDISYRCFMAIRLSPLARLSCCRFAASAAAARRCCCCHACCQRRHYAFAAIDIIIRY